MGYLKNSVSIDTNIRGYMKVFGRNSFGLMLVDI